MMLAEEAKICPQDGSGFCDKLRSVSNGSQPFACDCAGIATSVCVCGGGLDFLTFKSFKTYVTFNAKSDVHDITSSSGFSF